MMIKKLLGIVGVSVLVSACAPMHQKADYTAFRAQDPRSVLVVPVINRSVDVDAPDYFLSTISKPIAERGYYVFPVHLIKRLMEDEGLADADMVHSNDPTVLGQMFGADSIMYVSIDRWDSQYALLTTTTTVELSYALKSGTHGDTIWTRQEKLVYSPQQSSGGHPIAMLIAAAITAAIEKAKPNYIPLAQQGNLQAVSLKGTGLPAGPYADAYKMDTADF